jgi:hypothetical protein
MRQVDHQRSQTRISVVWKTLLSLQAVGDGLHEQSDAVTRLLGRPSQLESIRSTSVRPRVLGSSDREVVTAAPCTAIGATTSEG